MLQTVRHDDPGAGGRYSSEVLTVVGHDDRDLLPGADLSEAGEFTHAVLAGLVLLRRLETYGRIQGPDEDGAAVRHLLAALDTRLLPRLEGLRDALVRAHQEGELGTYAALADALGVARSTVSTRVAALLARGPGEGERWATGALAPVVPPVLSTADALTQVQPLLLALAAGTATRGQALEAAALLRLLAVRGGWSPGRELAASGDAWFDLMCAILRDGPQVRTAGDLRALVPGQTPEELLPGYGMDLMPAVLPDDSRVPVLVYRPGTPAMGLPAAARHGEGALRQAADIFLRLPV
ncbi:hypothetical protein ACGF0D_42740 [Kitasatospora sp. NPDC048298]|uniref:hypothetical protein n=1 Tax=Kitasatospora sp. NPDC048298 TaxID=3364049 RepID=UPI003720924D